MSDDSYYDENEEYDSLPLDADEVEERQSKKFLEIFENKIDKNHDVKKESRKLETIFFVADILNTHLHNDKAFKVAVNFMKDLPCFKDKFENLSKHLIKQCLLKMQIHIH